MRNCDLKRPVTEASYPETPVNGIAFIILLSSGIRLEISGTHEIFAGFAIYAKNDDPSAC